MTAQISSKFERLMGTQHRTARGVGQVSVSLARAGRFGRSARRIIGVNCVERWPGERGSRTIGDGGGQKEQHLFDTVRQGCGLE